VDPQADNDSSDAELLAAVLCGARKGRRGNEVATRLLRRFGGLRSLLLADASDILSCSGIGPARLTVIRALPELARRYYTEALPTGAVIRSPTDTETFLQARMRHLGHELFCCLFLDNRHRVLRFDEMFRGTIDGTSICRSCDTGAQSSVWCRGAQPGRRAHHAAPQSRAGTGRHPATGPPDHR
jgi:DNA repair protein RadC